MPSFTGLDPYSLGAGGTLTIEWAPHKDEPLRVAAALDEAAAYMENMYPVLAASRQAVAADVREHFAAGEGSTGSWPPLAGGTYEDPEFEFVPGQGHVQTKPGGYSGKDATLVKTGAGKAVATSIRSYAIAIDPDGGTITFDATPPDFMLAHNQGLPDRETHGGFFEGPNPLPQREWLWLSETAGEIIFELFEQFVADAAGIVISGQGGAVLRGPGGMFVPVNIQGTY